MEDELCRKLDNRIKTPPKKMTNVSTLSMITMGISPQQKILLIKQKLIPDIASQILAVGLTFCHIEDQMC
jgi:hypothetical protein